MKTSYIKNLMFEVQPYQQYARLQNGHLC
uniref:Uncharacterized protein n=1 Tax=Rhizophora mucronata TaxID=61149 RepID=A0A2P2NE40_RHIMU